MRTAQRDIIGMTMAAAGMLVAVGLAHANDGHCSYQFPEEQITPGRLPAPYEPIQDGHLVCGDDDTNLVITMEAGAFRGGGGYDRVFEMSGGAFDGGDGSDHVLYMDGGTFAGGDGDDVVVELTAGVFHGGDGRDHVLDLEGGVFDGGDGKDMVNLQYGGVFDGGDGADVAILMYGGVFDGGEGLDEVHGYCDGELVDVESVTLLASCP